ncbi:MAG: phage tail tip lysozyme [Candidatus Dormibacteria bacterium]
MSRDPAVATTQGTEQVQAAGIVGNSPAESGVNRASQEHGGGPGRGIAQWSVDDFLGRLRHKRTGEFNRYRNCRQPAPTTGTGMGAGGGPPAARERRTRRSRAVRAGDHRQVSAPLGDAAAPAGSAVSRRSFYAKGNSARGTGSSGDTRKRLRWHAGRVVFRRTKNCRAWPSSPNVV